MESVRLSWKVLCQPQYVLISSGGGIWATQERVLGRVECELQGEWVQVDSWNMDDVELINNNFLMAYVIPRALQRGLPANAVAGDLLGIRVFGPALVFAGVAGGKDVLLDMELRKRILVRSGSAGRSHFPWQGPRKWYGSGSMRYVSPYFVR